MIQWLKERRDISFLLVLKMYLHVPIGTHHLYRQLYACTVHTDIHEHETALIFDAHLLLYIFIHAFRCILLHPIPSIYVCVLKNSILFKLQTAQNFQYSWLYHPKKKI